LNNLILVLLLILVGFAVQILITLLIVGASLL
jgi:hypothetical protein